MQADDVRQLVAIQIAGRWDETNWHRVNLRSADDGYLIFYDEVADQFGLASSGFPEDRHPVVCGYYGDFWAAFQGM